MIRVFLSTFGASLVGLFIVYAGVQATYAIDANNILRGLLFALAALATFSAGMTILWKKVG